MAKLDNRSLHMLLAEVGRTIGDATATADELQDLANAIRRRSSQYAKDIEAIAQGRRGNGRRQGASRAS